MGHEAPAVSKAYEPRRPRESPLYRLVIDELESWVSGRRFAPELSKTFAAGSGFTQTP